MGHQLADVVRLKLGNALQWPLPELTPREVDVPEVPSRARAVIGMRRAGKTFFLFQCLQMRLQADVARDRLVYFNFEDERLGTMQAQDLGLVVEEYYRQFPRYRGAARVVFCFDEIQTVPGWERFVRRLLDEENVEIFISGSSAKMLSREVSTAMRGRAVEIQIWPFSFREFARHHGVEPPEPGALISAGRRSLLTRTFDDYIHWGGFPEVLSVSSDRQRIALLQGYVDAVLFRDVVERHGIGNVSALRALVRHLLRNPATPVSVSKLYRDFTSRGIAVSKETLIECVGHLEDSFLITLLPLFSRSERQRQVNPRKIYLADHGLARAFSPLADADRGHYLENAVACELFRGARDVAYYRTRSGFEIDFLVHKFDGREVLIQVASDVSDPVTLDRECRALQQAAQERPAATLTLITDQEQGRRELDGNRAIDIIPAWRWLTEFPLTAQ